MAKEKSTDKEEKKHSKKEKKEKHSEADSGVKKTKKEKKEKKVKRENGQEPIAAEAEDVKMTTELLNTLEEEKPGSVVVKDGGDLQVTVKSAPLLGALVPFANPLADEKTGKKVLKSVKKAAKSKTLKRGVKEVVKALRKSPPATSITVALPPGIVVLAADISPMDVISHLPVLCEDHGIPYIFVPSRAELGAAGSTKRPTSVVMIGKEKGKGEGVEDWEEVYGDLVKVIQKAGRSVRI